MKTFVWGTGRLTSVVIDRYIARKDIYAFIDNDLSKTEFMGGKIYRPYEIADMEWDAIVVATLHSEAIYKQCIELGINIQKVIFLFNNCIMQDLNQDYDFVQKVIGTKYAEFVRTQHYIIREVETYGELCFENSAYKGKGYLKTDHVRMKCLELAVKEINKKKILGEIAEVGVYQGEFAQYINYAFPNRKCYLFDTFEGFDNSEATKELKKKNCTEALVTVLKQTNTDIVLEKMPYKENVIIKKGLFPDSLEGLEEKFAFVSIDVDFEESTYECLKYFYPRLSKGGYIFVHDYNCSLVGVERAIDRYEKEIGGMAKVPICDNAGTLIITK